MSERGIAIEVLAEMHAEQSNKFCVGPLKFEAFGDRVLVKQDDFKTGYECETCHGTGRSPINKEWRCKDCDGHGALLIIPEVSERRPTTGVIVSIGPDVQHLKIGQGVMFSSFAGHKIDLNDAGIPIIMIVLHEPEILSLVDGHLALRANRGASVGQFHK